MDTKFNVRFKLIAIVDRINDQHIAEKDLSSLTGDTLQFMWKVATEVNVSSGTVMVLIGVRYKYLNEELVTLEHAYTYEIPDLKDIVDIDAETNTVTFKIDILPTLVAASYSTSRGITYERVKDTELANYPVPMISMDVLMSKNGLSLTE